MLEMDLKSALNFTLEKIKEYLEEKKYGNTRINRIQ